MGKRHRRIRARSATGQVAGAATEKPGLQRAHRPKRPAQPAFSQKAPRPSRPNLSPPPDTTRALKQQFHAPRRGSDPGTVSRPSRGSTRTTLRANSPPTGAALHGTRGGAASHASGWWSEPAAPQPVRGGGPCTTARRSAKESCAGDDDAIDDCTSKLGKARRVPAALADHAEDGDRGFHEVAVRIEPDVSQDAVLDACPA